MRESEKIIIIGAGIAGLTAAITLADKGVSSILVSNQQSERAGSCMAEGGVNAAIDPHDQGDSPALHYEETCKSSDGLADPLAIRDLTEAAPGIIDWLRELGTCFTLTENGRPEVRAFGGQNHKRTVFAGDSTGKQIMTALIDRARKHEAAGLIERLSHHSFQALGLREGRICGCLVRDIFTGEQISLNGRLVVVASGGYHGLFGNTTGARADDGEVTARLFAQGIRLSDLEFIQFHPTTMGNGNKRLLITEAARGEGGRLCIMKEGEPFYFMEEKYPVLKNLMPRDVTAREIAGQTSQVYLDMRGLDPVIFEGRLRGLMDECLTYAGLDPSGELIPVSPGIHYFMGGIWVDRDHETSQEGLYAAGECACCYHGANRLGGNSLLGAAYGGRRAAESIMRRLEEAGGEEDPRMEPDPIALADLESLPEEKELVAETLRGACGLVRDENTLNVALEELKEYRSPFALLAAASLLSALNRRESRGAHYRSDFPEKDEGFRGATIAVNRGGRIEIEISAFDKKTE